MEERKGLEPRTSRVCEGETLELRTSRMCEGLGKINEKTSHVFSLRTCKLKN